MAHLSLSQRAISPAPRWGGLIFIARGWASRPCSPGSPGSPGSRLRALGWTTWLADPFHGWGVAPPIPWWDCYMAVTMVLNLLTRIRLAPSWCVHCTHFVSARAGFVVWPLGATQRQSPGAQSVVTMALSRSRCPAPIALEIVAPGNGGRLLGAPSGDGELFTSRASMISRRHRSITSSSYCFLHEDV